MTKQKIKAILVDVIDLQTTKEEAAIRMMELESLINTYGGIAVVSTHAEVNAEDTTTLDLTPFANNRYNDIKAA